MSGFNPYRDWLKLSIVSDRPDHYQLLELSRQDCEERERVIEAAKRQLDKLKLLDAGQNRAALLELVTEIKAAAKCLSNNAARGKYDNSLRQSDLGPLSENNSAGTQENLEASLQDPNSATFGIADAAIPEAIPLAIPIADPNLINASVGQSREINPTGSFAVLDSLTNPPVVVGRKKKKRKSRLVFWCGHAVILVVAGFVLVLLRPELRARFLGGAPNPSGSGDVATIPSDDANQARATRSADQSKISATPEPPPTVVKPQSGLVRPSDNGKTVELPPSDLVAAKSPPMPDAAVDFYSRSIVVMLAMNDLDAAADLYSRMDSDSVSDQRLDLFLRLAIVANSYALYRDWVRECADAIPGGTSLDVGPEKLSIAIVEASPEHIIFRDRGVNLRYPIELVPNAVAWGVIDQMRPGEPLVPLIKPLAQYIKNWDRPEVIEQSIAQISAFEPVDSIGQKTKEAVLGWLQTDQPMLLEATGSAIDLQDARFTEALSQVAAKYAAFEHSEESIHEWILDAFLETESPQRVARFEYAKRAAIEVSNVSLALCLHREMTRSLDPADANEENIKLIQELGSKVSDSSEGTRLLVHILRFVDESKKSIDASQVQAAMGVASRLVDRLKLDRFSDALARAGSGE